VGTDGSDPRRIDPERTEHSRRPRFSPDGSSLVFGYQEQPEFYACPTQLIRRNLVTGEEEALAAGWDRSPSGWIFQPEGTLLFTAEEEGRSRLWHLAGDKPEPLTHQGWASDPTVSPEGDIHVIHHSLSSPPEVHLVTDDGTQRVSDFTPPAVADAELGRCRELTFTGGGDDQIQMWLVDPPGSDPEEPLPLVHMIHGGPHASSGDAWHWRWNAQIVAGQGYRVAMVNFHGSTGWGDGFARSIHGAWGDLPYRDVEAATDHLIQAGLAEPDRLAITGGSYGGYLVAWIISQTDRYACAIAHAAVTNLGGMYASDITYGRSLSYGAEIWEDREAVDRWSPAAHAEGYVTPTLVIHGHRDLRVPLTQGQELYGVLVAKGVPARLVTYPDQNHWVLSRADSIHWYGEFLDWLARWL
jgi:dipeptidyl aminopeptidase/acylaminoacyl peptidase